ncbi:MAG: hypothetical protein H0T84_06985 [Tatlockia sp.]|nr:hypothetical protein [Tatlockia sp.]
MIKIYQNPQPAAVERDTPTKNRVSRLAGAEEPVDPEILDINNVSTTEIFLRESEEEAWKDAIKKGNPRD